MDRNEDKTHPEFSHFLRIIVKKQKEKFHITDPSSWRNYVYDVGTSLFYKYIEPIWNKAVRIPYLRVTHGAYTLDEKTGNVTVQSMSTLLQSGDLIFARSEASATTFIIELFSKSFWTHVGIIDKTDETVSVLEAVDYEGVVLTSLSEFLKRYSAILIVRPKIKDSQTSEVISWARSNIGNSYDFTFAFKNQHSFYCSKFAWFAFNHAGFKFNQPPNDIFGHPLLSPDRLLKDNIDKFITVFEVHKFFYNTSHERKRGLLRFGLTYVKQKIRRCKNRS